MATSPFLRFATLASARPAALEAARGLLWPYAAFLAAHAIAALAFALDASAGVPAGWGILPADDTWVTLAYARNFAQTLSFSYNPGTPEAGMTSPLWVVLLGVVSRPLSLAGVELPALAQGLGVALGAGVSALAFLLVRDLTGSRAAGAFAGFVIALDPTFAFARVSGGEVALFSALALGASWALLGERQTAASVLLGLAVLARPEGIILVALVVLGELARRLWERETHRVLTFEDVHEVLLLALPALMAATVWATYNLAVTGRPLPNAFYVRHQDLGLFNWQGLSAIWMGYMRHTGYLAGIQPLATVGVAALGAYHAFRRANFHALALVLFPLALVYALSVLVPLPDDRWGFTTRRYLDPVLPFLAVFIAAGAAVAWRAMMAYVASQGALDPASRRSLQVTMLAAGVVLAGVPVVALPLQWPSLSAEFSWDALRVRELSVPVARWVDINAPADATIAVADPGALRYFTRRPLVDLTGLNYHQGIGQDTFALLERLRPDYVIAFDDLYMRSWVYGSEVFSAQTEAPGDPRGPKLAVFKTDWEVTEAPRDRVHGPSLAGLRLVDSLDVGDAQAELDHGWEMSPLVHTVERAFRVGPDTALRDDARITTGYEQFRVRAVPGKPLVIVKRYDAGVRGSMRVFVDERSVAVWHLPAQPYFFGEDQFTIPAAFITADAVVLRFDHIPDRNPRRRTSMNSFYYWVLVPEG